MRLLRLYVRFFRSFNYDYERKADPRSKAREWEYVEGIWFPFVRVALEAEVTAIVGANESGKSHLIAGLKQALTGEGIDRRDFCRYSPLFSVEVGQVRTPDFGIEFAVQTDDVDKLKDIGLDAGAEDSLLLLRLSGEGRRLLNASGNPVEVNDDQLNALEAMLPRAVELQTDLDIPDSLPLDVLTGRGRGPLTGRRARLDLVGLLRGFSPDEVAPRAAEISAVLESASEVEVPARAQLQEELGRSLLFDVARIDQAAFDDLEEALREGQEGRVDGLIEQINRSLARHLNFQKWWRQDRDFQLRVSPREQEIVFTIRDRTGTDYSFTERSTGLKYFLSYFVQLRAHRRAAGDDGRREILLMDEPDAYLSSAGQQDLLRILENFARPEGEARRDQVVYVTHSPFLINRNQSQRIRVLDKGSNEEGTRVVRDAVRNHYEPLRTSIGSHVAETAFIGGANLIVEGPADQVLLSGMSSLLGARGKPRRDLLDLNEITIVPAGSASNVPYVAYLARGRDESKPACIALLDGDQAGLEARKKLLRDELRRKRILEPDHIVVLSEWSEQATLELAEGIQVTELEDLIPAQVAVEAARAYARHLLGLEDDQAAELDAKAVTAGMGQNDGRVWPTLRSVFAATFDDAEIDKVGFARELVDYLDRTRPDAKRPAGVPALEKNFGALITHLAELLHSAEQIEIERRRDRRIDRIVRSFLNDYPETASRDTAEQALREIESSLEDTSEDDAVRASLAGLRRDFGLSTDPLDPVPDFNLFRERLDALQYRKRLAARAEVTGGEKAGADSEI